MIEELYNKEAEQVTLGSLLNNSADFVLALNELEEKDFYVHNHRLIFSVLKELFTKDGTYDLVTIGAALEARGQLKTVGGVSQLAALVNFFLVVPNKKQHIKIIKDFSIRRKFLEIQERNTRDIVDLDLEVEQVTAAIQERFFSVREGSQQATDIVSVLAQLEERQRLYQEKHRMGLKYLGFETGFEKLDDAIDGLQEGHIWVIGGWHGTGKTSFVLNILQYVLTQKIPCSIISLEMGSVDIVTKIIGIQQEMSSKKIEKGLLDNEQSQKIKNGKEFLRSSNLNIHSVFELDRILAQMRYDARVLGTKVFLIDYVQKITVAETVDETPAISRAMIRLANITQELKVSTIIISQISNEAQKGSGAGAGFKGSGTIEASADLALVLKRDKTKESPDAEYVPVTVQITKNKFGFDGTFELFLHLRSGKFHHNQYGL